MIASGKHIYENGVINLNSRTTYILTIIVLHIHQPYLLPVDAYKWDE